MMFNLGISAIRRLRKSDNNRVARACGATVVNRTEELQESDVGTGAGLFEIKKLGDEYFCFITKCKNPKVSIHFDISRVFKSLIFSQLSSSDFVITQKLSGLHDCSARSKQGHLKRNREKPSRRPTSGP